jgi:hypothetical protein
MWHAWGRGEVFTGFRLGGSEGKRPLGRPRRWWEDNIKMDLREKRIDGVNWIQLAQDRVQWWAFAKRWWTFGFHKESRIFFDKLSDNQLFK